MEEGEGVNIDFSRDAVIALHFSGWSFRCQTNDSTAIGASQALA